MATLEDALKLTRVYLNDQGAITWTDAILIGFIQTAYRELLLQHELAATQELVAVSNVQPINAGTKSLSIADMRNPVSVFERVPGETDDEFVRMTEVQFLPQQEERDNLYYWAWQNNAIVFLGATRNLEVKVDYYKTLPVPTLLTDIFTIPFAEMYSAARAAALVASSLGNNKTYAAHNTVAQEQLSVLLSTAVKSRNVIHKRIPFRRRGFRIIR